MDSNILGIIDINQLASDLGFSYLDGGFGFWEDSSGRTLRCRNMDKEHLKNSIKFIDKGIAEIKDGSVTNDIIKLLSKDHKLEKDDIETIEKTLIELLSSKKKELETVKI